MNDIYIFDLDGTLANCNHRLHLLPDWDKFFQACDKDTPIKHMTAPFCLLDNYGAVEIWTGRCESVRGKTNEWLFEHYLVSCPLKMRPEGDRTPGPELKRRWFEALSGDYKRRVSLAFDDCRETAEMWKSLGVPCLLVTGENQ